MYEQSTIFKEQSIKHIVVNDFFCFFLISKIKFGVVNHVNGNAKIKSNFKKKRNKTLVIYIIYIAWKKDKTVMCTKYFFFF